MSVAVVTMVHNEAVFLPMWLAYYGKEFGNENLFIIDHGSTDGSTASLTKNLLYIPRGCFDEQKRADFISSLVTSLLNFYPTVIFTDVDEFLVPDPDEFASFSSFLDSNKMPTLAGMGLGLLHVHDIEDEIDLAKPILQQRSWVRFQGMYSKPLITRVPIAWKPGFHEVDRPYFLHRDLYLFHLKAMDRDLSYKTLELRNSIIMSEHSKSESHSMQFFFDKDTFDTHYFRDLASNEEEWRTQDFDMTAELNWYLEVGPDSLSAPFGTAKRIPHRFRDKIPASMPKIEVAMERESSRLILVDRSLKKA